METFSEMMLRLRHKVARYDLPTCEFALNDCRDSLEVCCDESQENYRLQKTSEMEALNERKLALLKPKIRKTDTVKIVKPRLDSRRVNRVEFSPIW